MVKKSINKKKTKNKEHEKDKEEIIIQKQEKEEIEESELEQELEEEDFSDAPISFRNRTRRASPSLERINIMRSPQLIFDEETEEDEKKPERELYSGKETKDYNTANGNKNEKPEEYTRPGNTISSSRLEVSQPVSRLRTPETMKSEIEAWKQTDKTEDYSAIGHRLEKENKSVMPFGEKRDYELRR